MDFPSATGRRGEVHTPTPQVPVEASTGEAVVPPGASKLRDEVAVRGQRLVAGSGQIPMAADSMLRLVCLSAWGAIAAAGRDGAEVPVVGASRGCRYARRIGGLAALVRCAR